MGEDGYGQYCPVTRAVEVLAERWTLLIVRDMLCGRTRFNDLARGNPGLSRTLLSKRLRQLERAGVVAHVGDQYLLTPAGEDLRPVVFGLGGWGARWQFGDPRDQELDPLLLMWWVHGRIAFDQLPDRQLLLEFRFPDVAARFWVLRDAQGPSICTFDPGFGVDATVEGDLPVLYQVWLGRVPLSTALRDGRVRIDGRPDVTRPLPAALQLSPMAETVAAASGVPLT
ncbi:helix-turn-helix domain-containing protein [Iamia sp. SCSIO 61187]|uniref:winged helix-turn-helix transcriptional regulator n=1 Tax=Iamia sp. SCSIO 61187 TaxID=2722752 RepID=UPI001C6283C7|nr:helix-turn-helix domain-containing protein [Iamia sp. SCSIO 61187]